ncbi:Flp family type IVb pilin [Pelagibacterium xiamenense]|uniref:Flp family type IVb pilin n=1 Tax=Pelagibacterium xiamenense TaxID=2901140 RepID=UPI001E2F96F4|nr:Flp family type IVb pilin [Pelagibacterium xiamenense]MCD7058867.1 Flp family type IVb pilin [Pelagibacterium xiamenense]
MNLFTKFAKDESGATAIEYGLIAALMAVVVIAAIGFLGQPLQDAFSGIGDTLTANTPGSDASPTPTPTPDPE